MHQLTEDRRTMPGKKSTVAGHKDKAEIEAQIRAGVTDTAVARRFGLSRSAVGRYRSNHVVAADLEGQPDHVKMTAKLERLYDTAMRVLKKAEKAGDGKETLAAIKEARTTMGLIGKAMGLLKETQVTVSVGTTVNVAHMTEVILAALMDHPEARAKVAAALVDAADAEQPGATA